MFWETTQLKISLKSILNVKRRKRLLITVDNFIGVSVGGCIF